eukprot:ctg_979.g331
MLTHLSFRAARRGGLPGCGPGAHRGVRVLGFRLSPPWATSRQLCCIEQRSLNRFDRSLSHPLLPRHAHEIRAKRRLPSTRRAPVRHLRKPARGRARQRRLQADARCPTGSACAAVGDPLRKEHDHPQGAQGEAGGAAVARQGVARAARQHRLCVHQGRSTRAGHPDQNRARLHQYHVRRAGDPGQRARGCLGGGAAAAYEHHAVHLRHAHSQNLRRGRHVRAVGVGHYHGGSDRAPQGGDQQNGGDIPGQRIPDGAGGAALDAARQQSVGGRQHRCRLRHAAVARPAPIPLRSESDGGAADAEVAQAQEPAEESDEDMGLGLFD